MIKTRETTHVKELLEDLREMRRAHSRNDQY